MINACEYYTSPGNEEYYIAKHDKVFNCYIFNGVNNGIYKTKFQKGKYRIELWGASAGNTIGSGYNYPGGKGGYTRGEIELRQETYFTFLSVLKEVTLLQVRLLLELQDSMVELLEGLILTKVMAHLLDPEDPLI